MFAGKEASSDGRQPRLDKTKWLRLVIGKAVYNIYVPSLKLYEKILEDRFDKIKTCLGPREFHQKESSILDY